VVHRRGGGITVRGAGAEAEEGAGHLLEDEGEVLGARDGPRCDEHAPAADDLARRTGLSATTVRRRLGRLEASGALVFRCEVARALSGWPVSVSLWCSGPPDATAHIAAHVSAMREIRLCASLTGPHNLLFAAWLRSVEDLHAFESRLLAPFPGLTVVDRAVTLWPVKLAGHLLDPQGFRLGSVPLGRWDGAAAEAAGEDLLSRLRSTAARDRGGLEVPGGGGA
jgi:DNA-binding Lrp family transcriptional regulator